MVKYGVLFKDDTCQQVFEVCLASILWFHSDGSQALVGTLRAAKKRGIVKFEGQMLLSPAHDNVDITLVAAQ